MPTLKRIKKIISDEERQLRSDRMKNTGKEYKKSNKPYH